MAPFAIVYRMTTLLPHVYGSSRFLAGAVCVVTLDAYVAVHGQEPAEQTNSSVARSVFGWRELDGVVDDFPTDHSENVFYADSVAAYDEVHISPCYSWCV